MEKPGRIILVVLGIALLVGLYYYRGSKIISNEQNKSNQEFRSEQQLHKHEKKASEDLIKKLNGKIKWDLDEWYIKLHEEEYRDEAIKKLDKYIPMYRSKINEVLKEAKEKHCVEAVERCERELENLAQREKKVNQLRSY